jgi:hypothetical protein
MRAFGHFWYDFVVGDDWRIAIGVVLALAITAGLSATTALPVWWIVIAVVAILLPLSIRRATDHGGAAQVPSSSST